MRYCAFLFLIASCGPGTGKVQVFVTPEDTVTEGLETEDGWTVSYSEFHVTLGDFRAESSTDATAKVTDAALHTLELTSVSSAGEELFVWDAPAIRFDRFGYSFLRGDDGHSLAVKGAISKDGKTVTFDWSFAGETRAGGCGSEDGQAGFAVTAGGTTSIKPTIHGDHWFFSNSPHSTPPKRLAQWVADCDANLDGAATLDELKACTNVSKVFSPSLGYNFAGLIGPIDSAYDYFTAMARTLGHFNGDGECEALEVID